MPASIFIGEAEKLLNAINSGKGAFPIPETEEFMHKIKCHSLKAKSSDKADIKIILHDKRTKLHSEMGFSIKSRLGGNSTLINASKATNFTFRIEGSQLTDNEIEQINAIETRNKVSERYDAIKKHGGRFVFESVDNHTFSNNLTMLDDNLPTIIACLLTSRLETGETGLKELSVVLGKENPLKFDTDNPTVFYEYKIKHLLTSVALGMMPAKAWNGRYDATGGYLVVKEDGEIMCYHFYDRNRFEDYLFANAYLERSSTTRHEYATIIKDGSNNMFFKLNLQVRLK